MADFLTRGTLAEVDPEVSELIRLEAERQYRKLILIPSESTAPVAVREALGSVFQNLYAEGYPDEETRQMTEAEIPGSPALRGSVCHREVLCRSVLRQCSAAFRRACQ